MNFVFVERTLMTPKELAKRIDRALKDQVPRSQLAKEIGIAFHELLDFERLVRDEVIEKIERYFDALGS